MWPHALEHSADPKRAGHYLDQLKTTRAAAALKAASPEQAELLAALFSGSPALSELLIAHPDWLATSLDPEQLKHPRPEQGLRREVNAWLKPALRRRDFDPAFARLREFKQREMLRIAARDLARLDNFAGITRELSEVADVCLHTVLQLCWTQLTDRFGEPYHLDAAEQWRPTRFCVLGLGKLGGQELNYSSDVDVLFVYSEEGWVFNDPPAKSAVSGHGLGNHKFFTRLAEAFIAEVGKLAPEGTLYRIDLRLRPEGNAGPLVRSLDSYETFYAQWGQTWERMMLIKTRCVAGDPALAMEFVEMIQPFRYPRSLGERIFPEIAATKQRIENEVVKAGELDRNVKLGRGGIREIEFIVQTIQVLQAGRLPFLQDAQTLPALEKLVRYKLLPAGEAAALTKAYGFLRDVEHRLQMENNLQTHTIPTERKARTRLAALMGFASLAEFESARRAHTATVRQAFDKLFHPETPEPAHALPRDFAMGEARWKAVLASHSFRDANQAFRLLQEFVEGPGYVHVSARTTDLALQLLPRFFALCPPVNFDSQVSTLKSPVLSDPDRVLARLDSFITAYGARAMLYETWTRNPSRFELLLWLFDRSEFLAEIAIRTPDLVDELSESGRLRRAKSAAEILKDLRHGLADADQHLWLRRYHQAELMRLGLRDILGLADFEQNPAELSALADACLHYALEVLLRKYQLKAAPFAIIGLGKLGGAEINYGSDLDLLFIASSKTRNLPQTQRWAAEIMDLLSGQTELGIVFQTDARLRPDGEKGLLVNTLSADEDYYRQRALLWEIQTLTRARPITGDPEVRNDFQTLATTLTNFSQPSLPLASWTPHWKQEIAKMRARIESERTPAGKDHLAIKTGAGGLMDAEFLAQGLCMAHGWSEANTLRALQRAQATGALPAADAESLIENYRQLRRVEGILRRWSYAGETLLPDDPAPLGRVAVRCGFPNAEMFLQAVRKWRTNVRNVYTSFFS